MTLSPSRRRLILSALKALKDGRSVVVIAFPQEEAVIVARQICQLAKRNSIPIRNVPGTGDQAPAVRTRAFGQTASIDRKLPVWARPVVLIDLSACFERGNVREVAVRSVFA